MPYSVARSTTLRWTLVACIVAALVIAGAPEAGAGVRDKTYFTLILGGAVFIIPLCIEFQPDGTFVTLNVFGPSVGTFEETDLVLLSFWNAQVEEDPAFSFSGISLLWFILGTLHDELLEGRFLFFGVQIGPDTVEQLCPASGIGTRLSGAPVRWRTPNRTRLDLGPSHRTSGDER